MLPASLPVPSFATRHRVQEEMMDDFSIADRRLERALEDLRWANRWLGGYAAALQALRPALRDGMTLLDLGTGVADLPEEFVRWADRRGWEVKVTAVDANPATVQYAQAALDRRLPARLRSRIRVEAGNALHLPYADESFDVVLAALFLHHLEGEEAVRLLREMQRLARKGLVVSDLHRHPIAYYGLRAVGALTQASEMFRHDGPISILRGFRRSELRDLAETAGLECYRIQWRWAFRWILSTT